MPANPPLNLEERRELIAVVADVPAKLEALLAPLTAEDLTARTLPGEWTVAQNVHHLADASTNFFLRLKWLLTEERPTIKTFDQVRWAETPDAVGGAVQSSLAIIRGVHERCVVLLTNLADADWQRVANHPERGELTANDILRSLANHAQAHLEQIAKTRAARGRTGQ